MKCDEIRELISCMLDEELTAKDSANVTIHLAECPECMRVFEAFTAISLSLDDMEEVPEGFTADVMQRVRKTPRRKPQRRKQGPRFVRMAATAACLALAILAGSHLTASPLYTGGGDLDVANFIRSSQNQTPVSITPAPTEAVVQNVESVLPISSDTPDASIMSVSEDDEKADAAERVSPTPVPSALPVITPTPAITPTPVPVITPTPMPAPMLTMLTDLLIVVDSAETNRFEAEPDMQLTVTDSSGKLHELSLWMDGSRIYCMDMTLETAYYTIGTPAELMKLTGLPIVSPTPVVSPAP